MSNLIEIIIKKMKFNRVVKEDYGRIIGQIDSLKTNLAQLLHHNQDSHRTVKMEFCSKSKSPAVTTRGKNIRNSEKKAERRTSKTNKESIRTEEKQNENSRLMMRMMQIQESNQEMKKFTLVLEEMLRVEREKRKKLEKKLKQSKQKSSIGVQSDLQVQPQRTSSFKAFTPLKPSNRESLMRKDSKQIKTRQDQIESFLLGDCEQINFASPKKRNVGQIEIMQLIQQISRPGPYDKREDLKGRLLESVKKFIRK